MPGTTRIGMITPSSNTWLEPVTYGLLKNVRNVTAHFSRVKVTEISLADHNASQFTVARMVAAAALLADAQVDVVAWNGTSGSWLGSDFDREICAEIENATGIPTTTSTLAMLDAYKAFGITRVGIATPYTEDVAAAIVAQYAQNGIDVVAELHSSVTKNTTIGDISADEIRALVSGASGNEAQGIGIVCTNFHGTDLVEQLESELRIPVIDSVSATLWKCLDLAGTGTKIDGWGALMLSGQLRSALQPITAELLDETDADRTTFRIDSASHKLDVGLVAAESIRNGTVRSLRYDSSLDQRAMNTVQWMEAERRNLIQPRFEVEPMPARGLIDTYGVQAQMLGPVIRSGEMVGWLSAHSKVAREWTQDQIDALDHAVVRVNKVLDDLTNQFSESR